jgi:hypothetical protein
LDPKKIAHTGLAFRSEVHRDGGRKRPLGARYGDVSDDGGTKAAGSKMPDRSRTTTQ